MGPSGWIRKDWRTQSLGATNIWTGPQAHWVGTVQIILLEPVTTLISVRAHMHRCTHTHTRTRTHAHAHTLSCHGHVNMPPARTKDSLGSHS